MKEYKDEKAYPIAMEAVREVSNSLSYIILRQQICQICDEDFVPRKLVLRSKSIDNITNKINNLSSPLSEIENKNVYAINIYTALCKIKKEVNEIWR